MHNSLDPDANWPVEFDTFDAPRTRPKRRPGPGRVARRFWLYFCLNGVGACVSACLIWLSPTTGGQLATGAVMAAFLLAFNIFLSFNLD